MKKSTIIILVIIFLSFAVGVYFYPRMPEKIASHWGLKGEVNGYMSKFWGLFLMPIISVFMFLLFRFLPKIDPLKENVSQFRKYFDGFVVVIMLFLFYLYLLTIFWNLGYRFNMARFLSPAFGALFYCAGMLIKNSKRNWFIGIRTPWTMSNDVIWDKTHKLGAKLFKASGIVSFFGLFFPGQAFFLMLAPVIFSSVYVFIYSYLEFKKLDKSKTAI